MDKLQQILTDDLYNKLLEMHKRTASVLFNSLLTKHDKKFSSLLLEFNLPFLSPYSLLQSFNLNIPTISGPLKSTTPLIKPDDSRRTVINQIRQGERDSYYDSEAIQRQDFGTPGPRLLHTTQQRPY